jgi:acetyl/propionyl-CoA carboxylase alpha subunit
LSTKNDILRLAIVNRGEAAMRCVRAVKALRAIEDSDLRCIALYTDVDRGAPFVRHADIAVRIEAPGPTAVSAYLDHDVLMKALAQSGADAVWPGWGFVAEDADFADRVNAAGLRFLGPSGEVMRALGDKIGAKQVAEQAGVPVIPWSGGALVDVEDAIKTAERVGYPLMLKASAGGGGRGIRAVEKLEELEGAFRAATSEASSAFGDERLFIERRLSGGRHIEVQIAADLHSNAMALGSRDCSVQRRHQKVLEEAPPPGMDPALISELEQSAVRLARAVGYSGVGTVEYLVSADEFAFLEVNPRLQVEHGITEELTGVDLVQLQIRIARGEELPEAPEQRRGSAIEARVCAEDPQADFLPAPGRIVRFDPALGPRIRIDTGVSAQCRVPPDFDSLIAKVIATGDTREEAVARLRAALIDFELVVEGGATNKGFLIDLLDAPAYRRAEIDTEWLDLHPELREVNRSFSAEALVAAAVLSYQVRRAEARDAFFAERRQFSPTSIPPSDGQRIDLTHDGQSYRVEVFAIGAWRYRVHLDGRVVQVTMRDEGDCRAALDIAGRSLRILHDVGAQGLRVEVEGRPYRFGTEVAGQVRAGTPAMVVAIQVEAGDSVEAGQSIGLLEAMKMEIGFDAPVTGTVKEVTVRAGQQVAAGDLLLTIEPAGGDDQRAGDRVVLPKTRDPLALLLGDGDGRAPDLTAAAAAPAEVRSAAIQSARDEIRRVLMGYDVNPERGEHLQAFLDAELPGDLPADFRAELAEIRHELVLFADLEELFSRAPRVTASGETGPSNHAQLREYVRRYDQGGSALAEDFRGMLERALTRYGSPELSPSGALERGLLRLLASQLAPELRRSLVVGILRRTHALAEAGVELIDDAALDDALTRIAALRGLVPDILADRAVEARYQIFEAPRLHVEVERTTQEVAAWLDAAESEISQPPVGVLAVLAGAPRSVFDRVGRWVSDSDPRRRAVALAAHVRRLYAPTRPSAHTSASVGPVQVERLDFADGRIVLGGMAARTQLNQTLERLARAAHAAAVQREDRKVAALEIIVPVAGEHEVESVRQALTPHLTRGLLADRLTLTVLPAEGTPVHDTWVSGAAGMTPQRELHGIHPETARRIDLTRLRHFDLERLPAPDDLYCFQLRSPTIPGDERMIVLADVRTRSPKDRGQEASLHVPAFERYFFEAARCLRGHLEARDPRRRMQWNRILLFVSPTIYLDSELVEGLSRRLSPATRHLGLEKVVVRLNVGNRDEPESAVRPVEIVISDLTGSQLEFQWREPRHEALEPARDYQRRVVEARRRKLAYPYEIIRMLTDGPAAFGMSQVELPGGSFEEYDLDPDQSEPVARSVKGRDPGGNQAAVVFGIIETATDSLPEGMRRVAILSDPTVGMGSLAAPECDRVVAAIDLAERLSLPVEWIPVSSGARIAMESGTENLDATARVVRRIVTFTQAGGSIHVIVQGVNVGAQSYFDALATMLQHTRGVLIMTPGASMVLRARYPPRTKPPSAASRG